MRRELVVGTVTMVNGGSDSKDSAVVAQSDRGCEVTPSGSVEHCTRDDIDS